MVLRTNDGQGVSSGPGTDRNVFIAGMLNDTANGAKAKAILDNRSMVIILDVQFSGIREICRGCKNVCGMYVEMAR